MYLTKRHWEEEYPGKDVYELIANERDMDIICKALYIAFDELEKEYGTKTLETLIYEVEETPYKHEQILDED